VALNFKQWLNEAWTSDLIDIGPYRIELIDDGSLDTVLKVYLRVQPQGSAREYRFSTDHAAQFRTPDGYMSREGMKELGNEAVEMYRQETDAMNI
jgi:hypothetical protein